jgi:hypothetical protein
MTTDRELDALLSAPLSPVNDNGFSKAVTAKITARERTWTGLEIGAAVVVLASIVAFTPAAAIIGPLDKLATDLGSSVPFAIACAALVLTFASLRWLADEA